MIQTLHADFLFIDQENETDFEKAWRLQSVRKEGCRIPKTCQTPDELQYGVVGRLGEQVERLLDTVPREQVNLLLFDDLIQCPRSVYQNVLEFLAVPLDDFDSFTVMNERQAVRLRWVARLLNEPPASVTWGVAKVKSIAGVENLGLRRLVNRISLRKMERITLSPEFHTELVEFFEDDMDKLSRFLDRDLSHWRYVPN